MRIVLMVLLFLLAPISMSASLLFSLDSPIQTAGPGATLSFTGTLFNNDVVDVYLNAASSDLPYSEQSVDYTDFFTLVPLSLSPGESYNGPIFDVAITNAATPGDYFGSFTIQGGPDDVTVDDLATETFQISIPNSSAPEPSSGTLIGLSLVALALARSCRVMRSRIAQRSDFSRSWWSR
jgi:hypothetical protein